MFLQPKKILRKKLIKPRLKKFAYKNNKLEFGVIGLKCAQAGFISARQIEAARRSITRKLKRKGKVWMRVFPEFPVTKKPNESRMGKGVGSISFWAVQVNAGNIIFEICGVPVAEAESALVSGGHKLSVKTKVVADRHSSVSVKPFSNYFKIEKNSMP